MNEAGMVFQLKGLDEALQMFSPGVVSKAIKYALDRTGKAIKTDIVKEVSRGYNIKQKDIREKIKLGRVQKIGRDNQVTLTIKGARIPLGAFPVTEQGKGLVARIKKGEGTYYERGFYHKKVGDTKVSRSGRVRTEKKAAAFQRRGKERYPIFTLYGPSIPQLVGSEHMRQVVSRILSERMQKEFNHGISFYSGMVKVGGRWAPSE
jgi:hypothetical protein